MGRGEEVGSEQDSLEALCGCSMLLLGDKGDDDDEVQVCKFQLNDVQI